MTTQLFSPAGCNAPSAPVNGTFEDDSSTEEGAKVYFQCHNGYIANWNVSHCLNSTWNPDPQTLVCIQIPDGKSSTQTLCSDY